MVRIAVLKKNKDMVTRVINRETILMPLFKSSDDLSCIYTLNKVGSRVWELIDGKRNAVQIKQKLVQEFSGSEEEISRELEKFLKDLKEVKAIL